MSHASLKEQLQAFASQLPGSAAANANQPKADRPNPERKQHKPATKHQKPKVNKPKPKWLEHAQYGVELLKVYFPNCFKSHNDAKPLKKGIKEDLIKRLATLTDVVTEDKACMVKSLSYYVNTISYHKSVIEGASRIDLDGQPAGIVSADEAHYSVERCQAKLKKRQSGVSVEKGVAVTQPAETEPA